MGTASQEWGLDGRALDFGLRATGWTMLFGLILSLALWVLIAPPSTMFEWIEGVTLALIVGSVAIVAVCLFSWPLGVAAWVVLSRLLWGRASARSRSRVAAIGAGVGASLGLPLWYSSKDSVPESVPLAMYLPVLAACVVAVTLAERRVFGGRSGGLVR